MSELVVVRSKIKDHAKDSKGKQFNVAGDFAEALSQKVEQLIKDAARRAGGNNRATVKARDL